MSNPRHPLLQPRSVLLATVLVALPGCVEEGPVEATTKRGAPPLNNRAGADVKDDGAVKPAAGGASKAPARAAASAEDDEPLPAALPPRPKVALDAKSFQLRRDPFLSFAPGELVVPEPVRAGGASRKVEMQQYAFEDLKLIAIVNAGRGMKPRALFVASDGRSHSVKQGEYFSSAEVLLAAVNRDYVEVEVVDDDLASSLNLQRGERRAIYLRNE
jgi:Tfp pilus assembly protein PilP